MKVLDGSDRRWKVRRRWLPWRRRVRDVPDVPIDGADLGDDPISAIIGLFLLVLAIPAIVVVLLLLAELLLLLVLLPVFVAVRLLLPVPWTIELWSRPAERRILGWHLEHEVPIRGWAASQARIGEMAGEIGREDRGRRYVPREVRAAIEAGEREGPVRDSWATPPGGPASARVPGGAAPPATARPEVATGSPAGVTPNPFAQRGED